MLRILNCVNDEKFIDNLIDVMDFSSSDTVINDFICISNLPIHFHYVKKTDKIKILPANDFIDYLREKAYNVIIIHSLGAITIDLINHIPQEVKIVWVAWGFDLYSFPIAEHPLIKIDLYKPLTWREIRPKGKKWIQTKHAYLHYKFHQDDIEKAISRIDYFSGVISREYSLLKQNSFVQAKPITFRYFSLKDSFNIDNLKGEYVKGNDILVGNSGDPTNNHLDIFRMLSQVNLSTQQIYVPLSYGGTPEYRRKVKEVGYQIWGERFVPLETFIPYQDYINIINKCGHVVMYHERQQAMGNIYQGIWMGCKVYLSETGEVYKMFKEKGVKIFSTQRDLNLIHLSSNLENNFQITNREIMIQDFSSDQYLKGIYEMYKIIESDIYGSTKC